MQLLAKFGGGVVLPTYGLCLWSEERWGIRKMTGMFAGLSAEGLSTKLSHYFNTRRHLAAVDVVELSLDIWAMFCMHNFIIMYYALCLGCGSHSYRTSIYIYTLCIYGRWGWWLSARLAGDYKWMSVKCANRQRSVGEFSSIQSGSVCWIVGRVPRPRGKQRQLQCGCIPPPWQPRFPPFHSTRVWLPFRWVRAQRRSFRAFAFVPVLTWVLFKGALKKVRNRYIFIHNCIIGG